ncbi:twin-arginine translocase subunit TatC [Ornithinibacillus halotolerans]|uniref:Sec-independent protein translocase protein TatC n=1 Tax=Ornithinibacillus halotolerans TaxID=1274357 RepID=A0A916RPR9_9BACI|nr:twin-arginine translocase subunit TatC [Ornithinibacillus halotolerans]GGA61738.1 Sec-independent protein translocase protein TatCd [Ornithinibacillus halotolerans]
MARKNKEKDMHFTDHLSELRNRLIVTAIFFIACFIASYVYVKDIYRFFESHIDFQLAIIGIADVFWVYFTIAGVVALAATLPVLALQIWLFIKPGLTPREKRASLSYIPAIFLLFIAGLVAGYIMFIHLILPFLLSLNDGTFIEMFTVDRYFNFLFRITLPFAIIFEIPIISMFLTSVGILSPSFMRRTRKYAYFILVVVATMVTPPDFFLPIIVSIPFFLLYEVSVYLSAMVYRKKERKHKEFMEG